MHTEEAPTSGRDSSRTSAAHLRRRMRAWRNIATSATMRRVAPGWVPRPHAGHFMVTFKCNLKCQGCGSWKVDNHDDLSLTEWRGVFRQLKSLDIVKILGGEPLVRRDLVDLLTTGRKIGIRWEVESSRPLGIATWRTSAAVRNVTLMAINPTEPAAKP